MATDAAILFSNLVLLSDHNVDSDADQFQNLPLFGLASGVRRNHRALFEEVLRMLVADAEIDPTPCLFQDGKLWADRQNLGGHALDV